MQTKYRYIICNTWDGIAYGTNEPDVVAIEISETDNFVIDTEKGLAYNLDKQEWLPIVEAPVQEEEDEEEADS